MASQMQIRLEFQCIERAHQGGSLALDLQIFLGTVGRRDPWHFVQKKWNKWQRVKLHVRLYRCEIYWFFGSHMDPTVIHYDNQSYIKLSINPIFHDRSKHIDIRYHHLRDCVQRRIMLVQYIPTEYHDADILTKALTRSKFEYHRDKIGVKDNPFLVEREC